MMSFINTFGACFLAIIFWWAIIQFMEARLPVSALFSNRKYYYLSFVHARIIDMRLEGKDDKAILDELKLFNFPFAVFPDKKCIDDLNFVRELVSREDLVKRFLLQRDFDRTSFKNLCDEFGSPVEGRRKAAQMALWDIIPNPTDERVEKVSRVFEELCTPPFIGSDGGHRISAGENESNVFSAALAAGAIKRECTKTAFVDCIWKMKQIYGKMEAVKGKQGLSNHSDKPLNKDLYEKLKSMFEDVLLEE